MTQPEWSPPPQSAVPPPAGPYDQPAGYPPSYGYPVQLDSAGRPVIPAQRQPDAPNAGGPKPVREKKATGKILLAGVLGLVLGLVIGSASATTPPTTPSATAVPTNSAGVGVPPAEVQSAPAPVEVRLQHHPQRPAL